MKKKLASTRVWFFLILSWAIIVALAANRVPRAAATLHSAAGVGSNPLKTMALVAPKNLMATWIAGDVVLTWSAGGNGDGYTVLGSVSQTPNCDKVTWTPIGHVAGPAVTTFVDAKSAIPKGRWYCYTVKTIDAGWTSTGNPTTAVRDSGKIELVELLPTLTPVALLQVLRQTPTAIVPTKSAILGGAPARLTPTPTWTRGATITTTQIATVRSTFTLTPTWTLGRTAVPTTPVSATPASVTTAAGHLTVAATPMVMPTSTPVAMPPITELMTSTLPTSATATPLQAVTQVPEAAQSPSR